MGILIRGYAFDRSQRLHVVRRNGSSPPLCLCLSTASFASPSSCTAALQLFRRRLHLPVRKEKSRPRVVANCMLRKNTGASSACEETHSVFSHFFSSLQSPPAVSTGCTSCVGGNTQLLPSGSPPLPAGRGAERYSSLHRTDRTSTSRFLSPDTPPDLSLPSPQPLQKPLWPYRCPPSGRQALQSWYC